VESVIDTAQSLNVVPARHQYPIGIMYLYVSLVLTASTSLRGASKSLEVFISTLNFDCSIPSWPCGRLWLLRLGYYKLNRPKEKSDDWIWIADHVTQLGDEKCFVINGIRQSHLSNINRALTYEDIEPLAILPVTKSSGKIVFDQLEQTIAQTGIPREIMGDHGSDIKKGLDEFCKEHPQTSYIHDIKHKTALILKHEFEIDLVWQEFTKKCSQTKQKIQQTPLAFLNPKNQRTKARYMNIDALIDWGIDTLVFVEEQAKNPSKQIDAIEEKLGWIRHYKKPLKEWNDILKIVSTTEQFIREKGIREDNYSSVKKELLPIPSLTKRVKRFREKI
jgi:hypothetical protein